jgi:hypothetical protein
MANTELQTEKQKLIDFVRFSLGDGMVDVELDPQHYDIALKKATSVYRQRSSNGVEESYGFLELVKETQEYILPSVVTEVRQVFRRTIGSSQGDGGNMFEPFEAGYVNTYLMQAGRVGGLATYELFSQYQELTARMFGGHINFTYNPVSHKLTIVRKVNETGESVLLWLYNFKPDVTLLKDHRSQPWIYDYTKAQCKYMLGEARSKFATVAGPQGGTSMNGDSLKQEAAAEIDKLEQDLLNYVEGGLPLSFVIG